MVYLGRLTSTEQGRMSLERQDARSMLLSLLGNRMDVYLKLVVSCVDYRLVIFLPSCNDWWWYFTLTPPSPK